MWIAHCVMPSWWTVARAGGCPWSGTRPPALPPQVSGDASDVSVVGSMNRWLEPLPLERCTEGEAVYFQTTLYLPEGNYEYRYIIDGVEKVSEPHRVLSAHSQGYCNVYTVVPGDVPPTDEDAQETILHIRWHRSTQWQKFELIREETGAEYVPSEADLGCCLQVFASAARSWSVSRALTPHPTPPHAPHTQVLSSARFTDGQRGWLNLQFQCALATVGALTAVGKTPMGVCTSSIEVQWVSNVCAHCTGFAGCS